MVYCISGNHDRDGDDPIKSPSWVKTFSEIYHFMKCIDFSVVEVNGCRVFGIPYLRDDVGLENAMRVCCLLYTSDAADEEETRVN